jgi:hypothetical protein
VLHGSGVRLSDYASKKQRFDTPGTGSQRATKFVEAAIKLGAGSRGVLHNRRNRLMRVVLLIIIVVYGLFHVLGFVRAFELVDVKVFTRSAAKPMGLLWFGAFLLFSAAAVLYALRNNYWWLPGFAGVLISQILVIHIWKNAWFMTIPNVVILLTCVVACAHFNFTQRTDEELSRMFSQKEMGPAYVVTEEMVSDLPDPVRKWLTNSGIVGKKNIQSVHLRQKALIKMNPDRNDWSVAEAEQYFITHAPTFIWTVNMRMAPFIKVAGRDKFENGRGEMLIKILSLLPVVNVKDNEKINTAALQRYLGEIVWFPSGALSPYIAWEKIDDFSAKATMSYRGTTGSGTFHFNESGNFEKFSAMRYMDGEEDAQLKEWIIVAQESAVMNGVHIPVHMTATWKLDGGDWNWLRLEITEIYYNFEQN